MAGNGINNEAQQNHRTARNGVVITGVIPGTTGVYAFLIASLCRKLLDITSSTPLAWTGGPLFVVFGNRELVFLPDSLRKANIIG
jgi:hypothetical protein